MILRFSITILLAALVTGCAGNKRNPPRDRAITSLLPGGALLIGFNRNDDYMIDEVEFIEGRAEAFKQADINANDVISLSEFRSWQPKATGSITALPDLVYFDQNFNDEVTKSEFDAGFEKMFRVADENKDNQVSYDELITIVVPPVGKCAKSGSRERQDSKGGRGRGRNF